MGLDDANKITLGADPEGLLLQITGPKPEDIKSVPAHLYFQSTDYGWGKDGCDATPELRMKVPHKDAFSMVAEMKEHMKSSLIKLPLDVKLVAGSGTAAKDSQRNHWIPSGGHLHFGLQSNSDNKLRGYCDTLDLLLMVPMFFLEDPTRAKRRRGGDSNYGNLYNTSVLHGITNGDAYKGTSYGFEYRPPASWLVSESFARSILALGHAIVYELELGKDLPTFSSVFGKGANGAKMCEAHHNCDRRPFLPNLKPIYRVVKDLTLFKNGKYADQIAGLFGLAMTFGANGKSWKEDECIHTAWGFPRDYSLATAVNPSYDLVGNTSDPGIPEVLERFRGKRFKKKIWVYGVANKHKINFSLYGDFQNPDLDPSFFSPDLKETRMSPHTAHCWIGLSRAVREQATMDYIVEKITQFTSTMLKED